MLFNQLLNGDEVYILEIVGTFKKSTEFNVGHVVSVSKPYDEPIPQGQFQMPNQARKRVIDIVVSCGGESKKFTILEDRSVITDNALGLTISTDKQEIVRMVRNQYDIYKQRKESIAKCDEEMNKCQALLDKLEIRTSHKDDTIRLLQEEINQLKQLLQDKASE